MRIDNEIKNCCQCGNKVCHERINLSDPPEAEYLDGEAYCPKCWDFNKDQPLNPPTECTRAHV